MGAGLTGSSWEITACISASIFSVDWQHGQVT
jgi:hypothetical protein